MTPDAIVLKASDPAWETWLSKAQHDFYHSAAYHAFSEAQGEGTAYLAVYCDADQFLAWPYLLRNVDDTYTDVGSVYGYTGPVGLGLNDRDFLQTAWQSMLKLWRSQNVVSVFTRLHPILANDRVVSGLKGAETPEGGELWVPGKTVVMDTSLDTDARRALYPQPLRQDVKKAEKQGLTVFLDEDWAHFEAFKHHYRATMAKNDAADVYLFSDAYFQDLRDAMAGVVHLAVAKVDGEVAGAMMFTVKDALAAAHLTGSDPQFNAYSPLKCLIDRTSELARNLGAEHLHLGAGRGGKEDSLYAFKSRFSPNRLPFALGRWIVDANANTKLTRAAHGENTPQTGYFPSYRAPLN